MGDVRPESAAQDPAPAPERLLIDITVVPAAAALRPVVNERLADLEVRFNLHEEKVWRPHAILDAAADARDGVPRVWIDLRDDHEAKLLFWQPSQQRFALRRVALPRGLDTVGKESIGLVLRVAIEALVSGASFDLTTTEMQRILEPEEPEAPVVVEEAPAQPAASPKFLPKREALQVQLGALYGARYLAASQPTSHGPGLVFHLGRPGGHFAAIGWFQYLLPVEVIAPALSSRFAALTSLAGVQWHTSLGAGICVSVAGLAGADLNWIRSQAGEREPVLPTGDKLVASPIFRSMVRLSHRTRLAEIGLDVFADVDVLGARYRVETLTGPVTILESARIRPGAALVVSWP